VAEEEVILSRFVDRFEAFLRRFQVIIGTVVVLLVILGIFIYYSGKVKMNATNTAQSDLGYLLRGAPPPRLVPDGKRREVTDKDYAQVRLDAAGTSAEPFVLIAYADYLMNRERFKEAIELFDEVLAKFPTHFVAPHATVFRALALDELGSDDEAREILERFVRESDHEYWKQVAGDHLAILQQVKQRPASRPASGPAVLKTIELGE